MSLSNDAMTAIQKQIEKDFGSNSSNPRKFQNKNKSAQEAMAYKASNFQLVLLEMGLQKINCIP